MYNKNVNFNIKILTTEDILITLSGLLTNRDKGL